MALPPLWPVSSKLLNAVGVAISCHPICGYKNTHGCRYLCNLSIGSTEKTDLRRVA